MNDRITQPFAQRPNMIGQTCNHRRCSRQPSVISVLYTKCSYRPTKIIAVHPKISHCIMYIPVFGKTVTFSNLDAGHNFPKYGLTERSFFPQAVAVQTSVYLFVRKIVSCIFGSIAAGYGYFCRTSRKLLDYLRRVFRNPGIFKAPGKGDFRMRLMGWWDWSKRFRQWRENLSKPFTSTAKNTTEVCQKVSYGIQPAKIIQLVACGKFR